MQFVDVLRVLQIPILIATMTVIELWIPFRPLHRSYGRLRVNLFLTLTTVSLSLLLNGVLIAGAIYANRHGFGLLVLLGIEGSAGIVVAILALDLAAYAAHIALHKTSWGWRIHLVHHIDQSVDATTALRQHPFEYLIRFVFSLVPAWLLGASPSAIAIYRLLAGVNAVVEHSNIRIPTWLDRSLVTVWVSPNMHKIHHSRAQSQTDSNYGGITSCWDRLFRTYTPSREATNVVYGIQEFAAPEQHTLGAALRMPLQEDGTGRTGRTARP